MKSERGISKMLDKRKTNFFFLKDYAKRRLEQFSKEGNCFPLDVVIHPTTRCNHSCDFCYHRLNFKGKKNVNYDISRYLKLISELKELGTFSLIISGGGEPLKHKDITKIIQEASSFPFSSIYTNLDSNLNDSLKESLIKLKVINVNINTLDVNEYKKIRGKHANLYRVKSNLRELSNSGVQINGMVTSRKESQRSLENTIDNLLSVGASGVIVSPAFDLDYEDGLKQEKFIKKFYELRKKIKDKRVRILEAEEKTPLNKNGKPICNTHYFDITIGANEIVYPCCNVAYLDSYSIVDLKKYASFENAWKSKERQDWLDNSEINCKSCWFAPATREIEKVKK